MFWKREPKTIYLLTRERIALEPLHVLAAFSDEESVTRARSEWMDEHGIFLDVE